MSDSETTSNNPSDPDNSNDPKNSNTRDQQSNELENQSTSPRTLLVGIIILSASLILITTTFDYFTDQHIFLGVLGLSLGYLALFIFDFTKPFCPENKSHYNVCLVRKMITHGYLFFFVALMFSVSPIVMPFFGEKLTNYFKNAPLGVVLGCANTNENLVVKCTPGDNEKVAMQWVVNIGGHVTLANDKEVTSQALQSIKQLSSPQRITDICRAEDTETTATKAPPAGTTTDANFNPANNNVTSTQPEEPDKQTALKDIQISLANLRQACQTGYAEINQIATSPGANESGYTSYKIEQGVVIPLYVIVISLMGASVGLARRLPEYQKRSSMTYEKADQIEPEQVRESIIFQILQVYSAPLVAIAAYSAILPSQWGSIVILSFASGFSTEAVLLLIRKGVDRIGKIGNSADSNK